MALTVTAEGEVALPEAASAEGVAFGATDGWIGDGGMVLVLGEMAR